MASPFAPDQITVKHNESEHRFEAVVAGQLSVCDYHLEGDRMVITHTFVPADLRGRGIAEKLVRTALKEAQDKNLRVVPACSYVDVFIRRHAEFQSLVA